MKRFTVAEEPEDFGSVQKRADVFQDVAALKREVWNG
jgi:hypothetical protein